MVATKANEIAGLLLVDKPEGPTSHDVTAQVRRITGLKRIGHTGTLDPAASGLLLLCVGWVTRLAEYLTRLPKTYRGVLRLGERTDTDDRTGTVLEASGAWRSVAPDDVKLAFESQVGTIRQAPPAYSAKKIGGRRAYAVARSGGTPQLPAQRVRIERLALIDYSPPLVSFEIDCSSGTYIRAVARDLGEALGTGAHLTALRRTAVGKFRVEDALRLDAESAPEAVRASLLAPEAAVAHIPGLELGEEEWRAISRGRHVSWPDGPEGEPLAVFSRGRLVAIAELEDGRLRPRKVLRGSI